MMWALSIGERFEKSLSAGILTLNMRFIRASVSLPPSSCSEGGVIGRSFLMVRRESKVLTAILRVAVAR